jgi:hypothetical protein
MRSILVLWKNTRAIVLVAVCAAIYAASLIVFKTAIPLIPGITEVRVAGCPDSCTGYFANISFRNCCMSAQDSLSALTL